MSGFGMDLRSVDVFTLVQADGPEGLDKTIVDEKEFSVLQDALHTLEKSEAPIKYLKFNHCGNSYSMYPIKDTDEFKVIKTPILN